MSIIAQQLGRTVYYMLKRKEAFNPDKFYGDKKIVTIHHKKFKKN